VQLKRLHVGWLAFWLTPVFVVGLVAGGSVGWWIGLSTGPLIEVASSPGESCDGGGREAASERKDEDPLSGVLASSFLENLSLLAEIASLESMLEQLEEARLQPRQVASLLVSRMDTDKIEIALAATTGLTDLELEQVEDIEAYALRLMDVALDGVVGPDAEDSEPPQDEVLFNTSRGDGAVSSARDWFAANDHRIYALFPTDQHRVTIKWARTDHPEILLLKRQNVSTRPLTGWVYLDRPGGWEEGRYEVTVYSGDEALVPLASGQYFVAANDE
jgi:hypothetical protein